MVSWFRPFKYRVLVSDDTEEALGFEKPRQRQGALSTFNRKLITSLCLFLAFIAFSLIWLRHEDYLSSELPCGTSPAEARARGCIFEMIGSSWVAPDCYDPVTEQEFLDYKPWKFYKDYNHTQEATLSEVRLGEGLGYFVTFDYHLTHCGFLLKKFHRAIDSGSKVDGLIKQLDHTNHCVKWMLDPPKISLDVPQFTFTKFPKCGKKGGFNLDGSDLGVPSVDGIKFIDLHTIPGHQHDA